MCVLHDLLSVLDELSGVGESRANDTGRNAGVDANNHIVAVQPTTHGLAAFPVNQQGRRLCGVAYDETSYIPEQNNIDST